MAVWLLKFLTMKQTGADGYVYYGRAITYKWIYESIPNCVPERTLRLWMSTLKVNGYIEINYLAHNGMRIRIVNSKKWPTTQLELDYEPSEELSKSLLKTSGRPEENLSNCAKSIRQDLAGGSGRILPYHIIKEKDLECEKGKSAPSAPLSPSEPVQMQKPRGSLPPFRILFGQFFEKAEEKKKIS